MSFNSPNWLTHSSLFAARRANDSAQQQPRQTPTPRTAAPIPKKTRVNSKSTPTPAASEARLSTTAGAPHMAPLIGPRIDDLVRQIDPSYAMEPQAQEQLLQLADDFLEKVCRQGLRIAEHRGSKTLDVPDVQLALQKQWGIVIPGLGPFLKKTKPSAAARRKADTTTAGSPPAKMQKTELSATET
jgi:transcription initiation factor TFIID subunit TAF12